MLADPKGAIPAYDALLLTTATRARDKRFMAALTPLVGKIDVVAMRIANYQVDRDASKATPDQAAAWLDRRIGGPK